MAIYSTYSDEQLVDLLKDNNESAFKEIYDRYWQRMLAMAYLRLQNHQEAEDIVQEVFMALWQHRTEVKTLENWLATAVKYRVINLVNRLLRKKLVIKQLSDASSHDFHPDHRFLEQQIALEINNLPEKCRLVFQYSRFHGYSNKHISDKLNISEKAVEKHITSARRKLSVRLGQFLQSLFML